LTVRRPAERAVSGRRVGVLTVGAGAIVRIVAGTDRIGRGPGAAAHKDQRDNAP